MPNWTENHVRVTGPKADIVRLESCLEGDGGPFDFNRLLPMPEDLAVDVTAEAEEIARRLLRGDTDAMRSDIRTALVAQRMAANQARYGAMHWYDWCVEHWGTKWNACRAEVAERGEEPAGSPPRAWIEWRFDTAWDAPSGVARAMRNLLAQDFPALTLEWEYALEADVDDQGNPRWNVLLD